MPMPPVISDRCPSQFESARLVGARAIAYAGSMKGKLPFAGRVFWKVLVVVAVLIVIAWAVIVRVTEYKMTSADYGGSTISGIIFAYLVHLWLLPEKDSPSKEE